MKQSAQDQKAAVLVILLLLGASAFAFLALQSPTGSADFASKSVKAASQQANELSNSHLFLTSKRIELEQERRRLDNLQKAANSASEIVDGNQYHENYGVKEDGGRYETSAYDDLRRYEPEVQATSPSYEVQSSLFEKQKLAEYSEEYKLEYARQFVANARAAGYDVRLNSDFVVVSVSPITDRRGQMRVIQSVDAPVLMTEPVKESQTGQSKRFIPN